MMGQTLIKAKDEMEIDKAKNCKSDVENCKNQSKSYNLSTNFAKSVENCSSAKVLEKNKISAYVKALFTVYPSLPNIIKVVDNIVLQRASSIVPVSSVFGGVSSTMKEIEKVIDMSDRKVRLLRVVAVTRDILSGLSEIDYEIVDMKFFKRMKTESIASRLGIDERSVFRRVSKSIERCSVKCAESGFDSRFFCELLDGEAWIKEVFNKSMSELSANKMRGVRGVKKG
ncbi:MAG: sigma-70 family RNA polymerase sigma factor [Clostridia bacterium]|nr:sigma-70 family RNA polymerase sigma factor [Clostridia bacterium]